MQILIKKYLIIFGVTLFCNQIILSIPKDHNPKDKQISLNLKKTSPEQRELALNQAIQSLVKSSDKFSLNVYMSGLLINVEKTKFQNYYSINLSSKNEKFNLTLFAGPDTIKKAIDEIIMRFKAENPGLMQDESLWTQHKTKVLILGGGLLALLACFVIKNAIFDKRAQF